MASDMQRGGGYSGGLFDSNGPARFAASVSGVSDAMGKVVGSFVAMDTKASVALGNIESKLKSILSLSSQVSKAGVSGGGGGSQGGQNWSAPSQPNNGGVGGTPGNTTNNAGGSQPTSYAPMTTNPVGGVPSTPTSGPNPMNQTGVTPNGGKPSTMGSRAAESLIPAALGAVSRFGQGHASAALQAQDLARSMSEATQGGWTNKKMSQFTIRPKGQLAQSGEDYTQAQYLQRSQGMSIQQTATPGAGAKKSAAFSQDVNAMMLMQPGTSRVQATQSLGQNLKGSTAINFMRQGMRVSKSPEENFNSILNRLTSGGKKGAALLATLSTEDVDFLLSENGGMYQMFMALYPGDDGSLWGQFTEWVRAKIGKQTAIPKSGPHKGIKGGDKDANIMGAAGLKTAGYTSGAASKALQAQSSKDTTASQTYDTINKAAAVQSDASKMFSDAVNKLVGGNNPLSQMFRNQLGANSIISKLPVVGPMLSKFNPLASFTGGGSAAGGIASMGAPPGATTGLGGPSRGGVASQGAPNAATISMFKGLLGQANKSSSPTYTQPAGSVSATAIAANNSAAPPAPNAPSGPLPPGQLSDWVLAGVRLAGKPDSWAGPEVSIAKFEAGGNPKASNGWDSNAKAGHPSKGLMQTIDSTFASNAVPGHTDIWNPVDNVAAATNYIEKRYKDPWHTPGELSIAKGGKYKGYAIGSMEVDTTGLALIHRGERITPASENTNIDRYSRGRPSGGVIINLEFKPGSIILGSGSTRVDATSFVDQVAKRLEAQKTIQAIARG